MLDDLLERFRRGDRLALARLLTLAARGQHVDEILRAVPPPARPALVVAVTGGGGVGKSTLVGRLIEWLRGRGQTVAVLACDPRSPVSGGALLGDRFRMPDRPGDDGVFIRSLATAGGQGAVARHLHALIRLVEAFGFEVVLIETVGAGQGETAVRDAADVVVLLVQPETGDDLQWEKAGVLEIADVIAVHKADLAGAEQTEAQVRSSTGLGSGPAPAVVRVSSKTGQGVDALWQAVEAVPRRRAVEVSAAQDLLRLVQERLQARFDATASDPALGRLAAAWRAGRIATDEAIAELLCLLQPAPPPAKAD